MNTNRLQKSRLNRILVRIPLALILSHSLLSSSQGHQVVGINDGDTITLLVDQRPLRIRLANIDAPEKKQAFGERSRQSLASLCSGKNAEYEPQSTDRYGRTVAKVYCAGVETNRAQVERGMAWVFDRYNTDPNLPLLQKTAQSRRAGLWTDPSPLPPWEFRRMKKRETSR